MSVLQFKRQEPDDPHMEGNARCMGCSHKWAAVVPVGTYTGLECQSCHASKGVMLGMCHAEADIFVCNCGNDLFNIHPHGMLCANCGVWAKGF